MTRRAVKTALAATAIAFGICGLAQAQVSFYENDHFRGRTFSATRAVDDMRRNGFSDRASSVIVERGAWEVCEEAGYVGRCVVLRQGNYDSLAGMGMDNRITSARPARPNRAEYPTPDPIAGDAYEYRRRPTEQIFTAMVTNVRAVMGPPSERCWMEPAAVAPPQQGGPNVGGAVAGALIGGILGHQVGGGVGKDLATAGGAVAGGMFGSTLGKGAAQQAPAQVRRCETRPDTTPAYWDVDYSFRGVAHHLQMSQPPGRSIEVNARGEPRQ